MWTAEVVRARFVEAADVERRMFVKGLSGGGNAWPAYKFDFEDMAGWDDQARLDHLEVWQGRKTTKSPEITRWEETFFEWTALIPHAHRLIVWRWAQCIAADRSFSKWCDSHGVVRMTAYNRMNRTWTKLAAKFSKDGLLLREADRKFALQHEPDPASISNKMGEAVERRHHPNPDKLNFRSEASNDRLTTPAAVAAFAQHLTETNEARRKARLRKALRGVPDEQAAA